MGYEKKLEKAVWFRGERILGYHLVGFIGILNGLIGKYEEGPREGWGSIAVDLDNKTKRIKKFVRIENKD